MKLIYCRACQDIVRLHTTERPCICGRSRGRYRNDRVVQVFGPCGVLGIPNFGFLKAVNDPTHLLGGDFKAFLIAEPDDVIERPELQPVAETEP
jgi:hypothetical protein